MAITPGATGASFDVLLKFSLDPEANSRVKAGVSTLNQELERIQREAAEVGKKYEESGEKVDKTNKKIIQDLRNQARVMRAEAAAITDDLRAAQVSILRDLSGRIGDISTKSLVAGAAIVGGIFAEVNRYVKEAPEATRETRAWAAAMEDLGRSRARIDNVLLKESLPLLQQAARVAREASRFVERNPEIVSAALKTGTVLAGLGAIGTLVSKGIKLVADVKSIALFSQQLAAAKLQDLAADKQLAAAQMRAGQAASIPGGGGTGGALGAALPIAGVLAVNTAVTVGLTKQFDAIDKLLINRFGAIGKTVTTGLETILTPFFPGIRHLREIQRESPKIVELAKKIFGLGEQAKETSSAIEQATGVLAGSEHEAEVVAAFSKWKEDDARLVQEAAAERAKIIEEGERTIADITKRYTKQVTDINKRFNESRSEIIRDYNSDSTRAEEDYQRARADAIRDGQERLDELARERQERLERLEREGADRLDELARSRDALGLVKEQRRLEQERQEEIQAQNRQAAQIRRDTEARLAELARSFAEEQAQRRAQFEQALKENEAQRQEELKQAAELQAEEIRQAREAQAQKLRELQEGLNAERIRRREVFIAQIRDLDAALLGETNLRRKHYNQTLIEAQAFFNNYRRILTGGSTSPFSSVTGTAGGYPIRDAGGYVDRGVYRMAWDRAREFVMSGPSTKAAEKIVGGSLTQENLMRALTVGAARNVNYVDNRRMERPLSKDDRSSFQRMAEEALLFAIGV